MILMLMVMVLMAMILMCLESRQSDEMEKAIADMVNVADLVGKHIAEVDALETSFRLKTRSLLSFVAFLPSFLFLSLLFSSSFLLSNPQGLTGG